MSTHVGVDMPDISLPVTECNGCGACCQHIGWVPFHDREEIATLPDRLKAEVEKTWHDHRREAEPCPWFIPGEKRKGFAGACANYDHRPKVCRDWKIGGLPCLDMRKLYPEFIPVEPGR